MARFDYYDKFSELEKDNIKAREGGIRDLHMRVKQMQYDNLIMSEAIMNNNKNINNIFELLQDEVDLSSRTYLWDDTPRLDLDNHPDVILETGNNNTIPYMCTEYKHIKSGSRVDVASLRKDYNFKVFLGVADNLERPAFLVSYFWLDKTKKDNPVFFVEPMNLFALDEIERLGLEYERFEGILNSNGSVKGRYKFIGMSERQFVKFSYSVRCKLNDQPIRNKYLCDTEPTLFQKKNYVGIYSDEDEEV